MNHKEKLCEAWDTFTHRDLLDIEPEKAQDEILNWFLERTIPKEEVVRIVGADEETPEAEMNGDMYLRLGRNQERQRILKELKIIE